MSFDLGSFWDVPEKIGSRREKAVHHSYRSIEHSRNLVSLFYYHICYCISINEKSIPSYEYNINVYFLFTFFILLLKGLYWWDKGDRTADSRRKSENSVWWHCCCMWKVIIITIILFIELSLLLIIWIILCSNVEKFRNIHLTVGEPLLVLQ